MRHDFTHGMYLRERPAAEGGPRGEAAARLVLIHGLGESGLCFEGLLAAGDPRLAGWHLLAPDMPGYGKSPWPDEPLSLAEHADHLARWMAETLDGPAGSGPAVVLGHSMGGVIATLLAERHPRNVRALLNVEGNVSLADCGFSSRAVPQARGEFVGGGMERLLDELYRDGQDDPAIRTYYPSVRICDPRAFHRNSVELVEMSRAGGLAERIARLGVPRLYVRGLPRGSGERSRELLDRAGVAWMAVDGSGHWPFLDQPAAFLDIMVEFLGQVTR